ncbi:sugar ABC transporter [Nocardioides aromaticivorans]|uniref:Sugar ABC transporter n=1 Tax=Nocardioides aromaticivorans TaxID=200618 RepID=A0ABX7PMT0_9ACTN|nr:ABC transporter ATP-binding protein [Nocardioides aromaticivorans]QSR27276.1 sugar ABC transporter [Nocardioides aromaticivorans]
MSTALELRGITKRFGAVPALTDVDLTVRLGEVHCVLGENGAGKSTLCHLVYGAAQPDAGSLRLFGEEYAPRRPVDALRHGVAMVHQHFSLVPTLSVGENLLLGEGPRVRLRRREVAERVARIEADYGLAVDLDARTSDLTVGERQSVEIVKALLRDPRLVILDEPTAVLGPHDLEALLTTCRRIADAGRSVVLVTHKLGEIEAVGDTATVLRGGRLAGTGRIGELGRERLVSMMIGRSVDELGSLAVATLDVLEDAAGPAEAPEAPGIPPVVVIEDLRVPGHGGAQELAGVDLALAPGEIVGVAGVEGNGQSELVAALSGAIRAYGRFTVDGTELLSRGPRDRTAAGVGVIPEDRHREGCIPSMTVADNLFLGSLGRFRRRGLLDRAAVRRAAAAVMDEHGVVAAGPDAALGTLSGGNQQKVVVARELAIDPLRLLVAAHPTRGLDVGAVDAVLSRIRQAAAGGAAVLLVSSELPELLLLCDRILVAYRGRLLGPVVPGSPTARAEIGELMVGAAA